ncbi:MAG: DUF378 domain-containing protein [Clostridia bacterium]
MRTFNVFSVISLILVIIGALNWMVVGIFNFNFVSFITGTWTWLERTIYILVGVASIYLIIWSCVRMPIKTQQAKN